MVVIAFRLTKMWTYSAKCSSQAKKLLKNLQGKYIILNFATSRG
jgi:hypothetical protein